jgi:hypothetical protein
MSISIESAPDSISFAPCAPTLTREMGLREAGDLWLSTKEDWKRRKPRTIESSRCYLKSLIKFFGDIPLKDIHAGSFLAYQTKRGGGLRQLEHSSSIGRLTTCRRKVPYETSGKAFGIRSERTRCDLLPSTSEHDHFSRSQNSITSFTSAHRRG